MNRDAARFLRSALGNAAPLSAVLAAAVALGSCGIDQGGMQAPPPPTTMVVSGPITGFGSILVNGLTLDTQGADVRVDGNPGSVADLREGQIIRAVAVREGTGTRALVVEYEENVVGPVATIDAPNGTLSVLGQPIATDASTRFDGIGPAGLADLAPGDAVAVSGFQMPSGSILATYIARVGASVPYQVTAAITDLDAPALTLELGGLTVDYSQAAVLQVSNGMPAIGLVVEVRGSVAPGNVLVADEVRGVPSIPGLFDSTATQLSSVEQPVVGAAGASTDLAANFIGFITAANLPGRVSLVDVDVLIDTGTVVVGGTANELGIGVRVQVEGEISTLGQIKADRITIL